MDQKIKRKIPVWLWAILALAVIIVGFFLTWFFYLGQGKLLVKRTVNPVSFPKSDGSGITSVKQLLNVLDTEKKCFQSSPYDNKEYTVEGYLIDEIKDPSTNQKINGAVGEVWLATEPGITDMNNVLDLEVQYEEGNTISNPLASKVGQKVRIKALFFIQDFSTNDDCFRSGGLIIDNAETEVTLVQ